MAYKIAFERMNSIRELLAKNEARTTNKAFADRKDLASQEKTNGSWEGTKTYDEAKDLIINGWDEPLAQLKDAFKKNVSTNTQADKRRPSTGVIGYAPCVPNAIMGLPNSMISTETVKQKVKAVTVVYGTSVHSGWSTKEMIDAGITMLKIVKNLESQGIRVRVTVEVFSVTKGNDLSVLWMDVKDWREAIDLKKLTFPLAHPSMLRRIGFKWLETCPEITNTGFRSGYGTPLSNDSYEKVVSTLKQGGFLNDNEYYINASLCKECKFDPLKVMERAGMTALKGGDK